MQEPILDRSDGVKTRDFCEIVYAYVYVERINVTHAATRNFCRLSALLAAPDVCRLRTVQDRSQKVLRHGDDTGVD